MLFLVITGSSAYKSPALPPGEASNNPGWQLNILLLLAMMQPVPGGVRWALSVSGGPLGDLLNLNTSAQRCRKPRNSPCEGCSDEPGWAVWCNQLLVDRTPCCASTTTTGSNRLLPCPARNLVREAKNYRDHGSCLPPGLLPIVPCVMHPSSYSEFVFSIRHCSDHYYGIQVKNTRNASTAWTHWWLFSLEDSLEMWVWCAVLIMLKASAIFLLLL